MLMGCSSFYMCGPAQILMMINALWVYCILSNEFRGGALAEDANYHSTLQTHTYKHRTTCHDLAQAWQLRHTSHCAACHFVHSAWDLPSQTKKKGTGPTVTGGGIAMAAGICGIPLWKHSRTMKKLWSNWKRRKWRWCVFKQILTTPIWEYVLVFCWVVSRNIPHLSVCVLMVLMGSLDCTETLSQKTVDNPPCYLTWLEAVITHTIQTTSWNKRVPSRCIFSLRLYNIFPSGLPNTFHVVLFGVLCLGPVYIRS